MNETNLPNSAPDVTWPTPDDPMRDPDTSMFAHSEPATPAAVDVMNNAVQGAHNTLDRLADRATPAMAQLDESLSAAKDTLHVKTDQLRELRDDWVDSARTTVRNHPLAAVAAAATLGLLIARITR